MIRRFPRGTFRLLTVAQQHPDIVERLEEAAEVAHSHKLLGSYPAASHGESAVRVAQGAA